MSTTIIYDRPRTHPHLVCATLHPISRGRIEVTASGTRATVAEIGRGSPTAVLRIGDDATRLDALSRSEQLSGGSVVFATTGPKLGELRPRIVDGATVAVGWTPGAWEQVRVRFVRWFGGAIKTGVPEFIPPVTVPASKGEWDIPDELLTGGPLEVLLTPFVKGRQGRTESKLFPARLGRIEVRFRHVMIGDRANPVRRLRVEVRAHDPAPRPIRVAVRWTPCSGQPPRDYVIDWPHHEPVGALLLPEVSVRGDTIDVRIDPAQEGSDYVYAVQLTPEERDRRDTRPAPAAILARGTDLTSLPEPYKFSHGLPVNAPPLTHLPRAEALPLVRSLVDAVVTAWGLPVSGALEVLPSSVLGELVNLGRAPVSRERLRQLLYPEGGPLDSYLMHPEWFTLATRDSELREVAERSGTLANVPPTTAEHLIHAWEHDPCANHHDADRVRRFLRAADDTELNLWVGALARGATPDMLREFRAVRKWDCDVSLILRAFLWRDQFALQPASALVPQLLPNHDGDVYRGFVAAAQAEEKALSPRGTPDNFRAAGAARDSALQILIGHLTDLTTADRVAADLLTPVLTYLRRNLTVEAAAELDRLRSAVPGAERIPAAQPRPAVLRLEQAWTAERASRQGTAEAARRVVADWCRELFVARRVPEWEWRGTGGKLDPEREALERWRLARAVILALPRDGDPENPELTASAKEVFGKVAQHVVLAPSAELRAAVAEMLMNAPRVAAWLDESRARALLVDTIRSADSLQSEAARALAEPHVKATKTLLDDPRANLAELAHAARSITGLHNDERAWRTALALTAASPSPTVAGLSSESIESAQKRLESPEWQTQARAEQEEIIARVQRLYRLREAFAVAPTAPNEPIRDPELADPEHVRRAEFRRLSAVLQRDAEMTFLRRAEEQLLPLLRSAFVDRAVAAASAHPCAAPDTAHRAALWFQARVKENDWDRIDRAHARLAHANPTFDDLNNVLLGAYTLDPSFAEILRRVPFPHAVAANDLEELHRAVLRARETTAEVGFLLGEPEAIAEARAAIRAVWAACGTGPRRLEDLNTLLRDHAKNLWRRASGEPTGRALPQVFSVSDLGAAFRTLSEPGEQADALAALSAVGFFVEDLV